MALSPVLLLAAALLPVVPQDQHEWGQESSCGTTSLATVCEFYRPGALENDRQALDRYLLNGDIGTAPDELARWAELHGYRTAIKTGAGLRDLVALLERGVPIQALIDRGAPTDGSLHYVLVVADSHDRATHRVPAGDFLARWSALALWSVPLGIDRLIVAYVPAGRTVALPGNGARDPFDESQPARAAGKAFMNLANGWARRDPARVAAGVIQGAGAAVGTALALPGHGLGMLDGPAGGLGGALVEAGALAAWGMSRLGDALRVLEIPPEAARNPVR